MRRCEDTKMLWGFKKKFRPQDAKIRRCEDAKRLQRNLRPQDAKMRRCRGVFRILETPKHEDAKMPRCETGYFTTQLYCTDMWNATDKVFVAKRCVKHRFVLSHHISHQMSVSVCSGSMCWWVLLHKLKCQGTMTEHSYWFYTSYYLMGFQIHTFPPVSIFVRVEVWPIKELRIKECLINWRVWFTSEQDTNLLTTVS